MLGKQSPEDVKLADDFANGSCLDGPVRVSHEKQPDRAPETPRDPDLPRSTYFMGGKL